MPDPPPASRPVPPGNPGCRAGFRQMRGRSSPGPAQHGLLHPRLDLAERAQGMAAFLADDRAVVVRPGGDIEPVAAALAARQIDPRLHGNPSLKAASLT